MTLCKNCGKRIYLNDEDVWVHFEPNKIDDIYCYESLKKAEPKIEK